MKNIIIPIIASSFLLSCKCKKIPNEVTHLRTEKIIQRDTVYTIPPDSSQYKANLVNNVGQFVLENIKETKSITKKLSVPKVTLQNNQLQVDCYLDEQKLYAKWKETHINDQKSTIQKVEVTKPLAFWQKILMYCGVAFLCLVLFVLFKIIKTIKK